MFSFNFDNRESLFIQKFQLKEIMNSVVVSGPRVIYKSSRFLSKLRNLCGCSFSGDEKGNDFINVEEPLKKMWGDSSSDVGFNEGSDEKEHRTTSLRRRTFENARHDAKRVLDELRKDGLGFDAGSALSELDVNISELLVREVLMGILRDINQANKTRLARLGFKFFVWVQQQERYRQTANSYHLLMKIFAECEEYKAMWRLLDEMINKGLSATPYTFKILICTCGEAGLARNFVQKLVKSTAFNFRPYKHSYNAILHSLFCLDQYELVEWVYEEMLAAGHSPDVLTYNVVIYTKYRLGKKKQFYSLCREMKNCGVNPDLHTYNIFLHHLGSRAELSGALNLLKHMKETGIDPSLIHFTTLMDGLSRANEMDACEKLFDQMIENGWRPDVVSYTVIITGYVYAGKLEKAQVLLDEMISKGLLPNVFTYNSMVRGFCMAGKFEKACSVIKEMESRGCNPNFVVYSTLVKNLRKARRDSEAEEIENYMRDRGQYVHLIPKIRKYKRC